MQRPKEATVSAAPRNDTPPANNHPNTIQAESSVKTDIVSQRETNFVTNDTGQDAKPAAGKFDWPHWRGPSGNGISAETGLIHEFPESGPEILWRKTLGTGFSGLTVSGGRLFTMFGEEGREKLICFDAKTGREIWKIDSDADFAEGRSFGPRSTPCVDGNHVYAMGASGKLHCLESATGKPVWSFNIYDKFEMRRFFDEEGVSCSPLIDGKKLIMLAGIHIFAFDKTNGKVIWKVLEEKMRHSTPAFATFGGHRQLVALTGSNLVGLDPESGRELWRHPQGGACVAPVVGLGNQIYAAASYGAGGQLVKIADDTATQVYKTNKLSTHHATAMLYNGHLYGFHDRPGIFKCLEFATGEEKWVSRSPGKGKLIIADGQMIIITEYGELVLAKPSPNGYSETAKARVVKGTCYTAPTLANGKLYIRSDKEMVCIEMKK
ncbi:MAG: PQQ-like beta-propeller repeat protein [Planctomycetaceae bacterium]|nr:PQQ-like beta-propeller repeat protein [Planctomycetaceae bacterium]